MVPPTAMAAVMAMTNAQLTIFFNINIFLSIAYSAIKDHFPAGNEL
jgi:hypothetical protein